MTETEQRIRMAAGRLGGVVGVAGLAGIDRSQLQHVMAGRQRLRPDQVVRLHDVIGGDLGVIVRDAGNETAVAMWRAWDVGAAGSLRAMLVAASAAREIEAAGA